MNRRELLMGGTALTGLTIGGQLFAAPTSAPRFLLVFLRGGYDCANLLVPIASDFYYEARPTIAIARPDEAIATTAIQLDSDWGLTPILRESIAPLYAKRQLAFVPFAGTDDVSRSHFETQDSIELGQTSKGSHDFSTGFLARLSSVLNGSTPIAFTDSLPLVFKSKVDVPNISLRGLGKPVFDERQAQILTNLYTGHHLQGSIAEGLELRQEVSKTMQQEMEAANRGAITAKGFELEAKRIGQLMREQYRLGFVDIGGWDSHVNEGADQGQLANNLDNLGRGLKALSQELGSEWQNTVVVVLSEFGRTFRENGNHGTDHGHGSVYWVLGGAIDGGRIVGEQVRVEKATLFQDRDYPVLNDYRGLLGGLFTSLWGLSEDQCERVFPGSPPIDLKLV
jgi:uncharacterized protein (DUF1501 family)